MPMKQRDLFTKRWSTMRAHDKEVTSLHIPLVAMLRWCLKPEVIFRHVPNGEHRDPRTAAKLKAMGVLPGSADLEFFWEHYWEDPDGSHISLRVLFLELKLPRGRISPAQQLFAKRASAVGAEYIMVFSIDAAIQVLGERGLIKPSVEVCGKRW